MDNSPKRVKIPAKMCQIKCYIETEVVPAGIPVLLCKASLKKAGAVLEIKNDKAVRFKKTLTFELTTSGHYCINILDKDITRSPCNNSDAHRAHGDSDSHREHEHKGKTVWTCYS
jgi:hypothetical protein